MTFSDEIEENTLSSPKEIPLSVEGGRGIPEKREGTTSKVPVFGLMRKSYLEKAQERYLFGIAVIWRIKEVSADDTGTGRRKI